MAETNTLKELQDLVITVKINEGEIIRRSLKDDLDVDEDNLNNCLIQNPGKTAYWNALYQKVRSRGDKVATMLRNKEAELDKQIREANPDYKEAQIKSLITLDQSRQQIETYLLNLREQEGLLKAAIEALRDLRSTLISLSANLRTELGGTTVGKKVNSESLRQFYERTAIDRHNANANIEIDESE